MALYIIKIKEDRGVSNDPVFLIKPGWEFRWEDLVTREAMCNEVPLYE